MKLAAVSSFLLVYGSLAWLGCFRPAAAEPPDAGPRAVRFPPVADRLPPPNPSTAGKRTPNDDASAAGRRERNETVRFPAVEGETRRFPPVPDREAPGGPAVPRLPVGGTTSERLARPVVGTPADSSHQPRCAPTSNPRSLIGPPQPLPGTVSPSRLGPRLVSEPRVSPSDRGPRASPTATANDESEPTDSRQPIGPKPPENTNEWLARDTSLLLKPGKVQTEIGALYTRQEIPTVVVLPTGAPVLERIRSRAFVVPFSIRYGWSDNVEVFSVVPFGISLFERDNVLDESTEETGTLGDITAGLVYQLPDTRFKLPDSAVSFSVVAPTSSSSVAAVSEDQATLGYGVWKVGVGFNFVESFDPIVVFGGLGYQYQFSDVQQGLRIQRGDVFNYYCGLGLAVSDDVSLSTQVSGFWQDKSSLNDIPIPNSDIEPLSVRLGFVRRLTLKSRIQPYVEFGLTRDAADTTLGLRYIHDE